MTTTHTLFEFVAGDDWQISAELLDQNGNPYNLTNAQILWTLVNNAGQRILQPADVAISITNAALGLCSITVPSSKTTAIFGGRYNYALRIVTGGVTSTLCIGPIQIIADPWKVATTAATLRLVA